VQRWLLPRNPGLAQPGGKLSRASLKIARDDKVDLGVRLHGYRLPLCYLH